MILGYIRCSTEEQCAEDKTSMARQEEIIRGFAQMKGVPFSDIVIFEDPGVSGSIALQERPGGKQLLDTTKKGDCVVTAKLDRLFRSARDALNVSEDLKNKGIDLVLCDIGTEPVTANGVSKMFFQILAVIAEFERDRIRERMIGARNLKNKNGGYIGGAVPYGYKVFAGKLVPKPDEYRVIELAQKLRPTHSIHKIVLVVNERGWRNRMGNEFQWVEVKRMLARAA